METPISLPSAKDPVSATWMRRFVAFVVANRILNGPGYRTRRGPNGMTLEIDPSSKAPSPTPDISCFRVAFKDAEDAGEDEEKHAFLVNCLYMNGLVPAMIDPVDIHAMHGLIYLKILTKGTLTDSEKDGQVTVECYDLDVEDEDVDEFDWSAVFAAIGEKKLDCAIRPLWLSKGKGKMLVDFRNMPTLPKTEVLL